MIRFRQYFLFFASLKLAVISLLGLAAVLSVGTVIESMYGMRAAHLMVYGSPWFGGVLLVLGINVLCAALSRYPWKIHQTGFVVTHAGIIILLVGSVMTQQLGVDGNLPIEENKEGDTVLLSDLKLFLTEEGSQKEHVISIPESGRYAEGDLLAINLNGNRHTLKVSRFAPRVRLPRKTVSSEVEGLGTPSIGFYLRSSRFNVRDQIFSDSPGGATELNIGPAVFSFQKLWNKKDEKAFLSENKTGSQKKANYLTTFLEGREYRINVEALLGNWQPLGDSGHQIRANRFFTHAVVEKNELVNKSNKMVNPALMLEVRTKEAATERHTVFANFPQFPTLHRRDSSSRQLGLRFRLATDQEKRTEMGIVGSGRGKFQVAQSADDKTLYYRVLSAAGKLNGQGELKPNEPVPTGWMDATFELTQWFPNGVRSREPIIVDRLEGNDSNYLSAVHLEIGTDASRLPASEPLSQWVFLGETKRIVVGDKRLLVRLGKETLKLPFSVKLNKFEIGRDPGTTKAASYQSTVTPISASKTQEPQTVISMNEPLHYQGYTLYQASYQERPGQPYISIFSVNKDPGRWIKYLGSLMITLGALIMFAMNPHYFKILLGKKPS